MRTKLIAVAMLVWLLSRSTAGASTAVTFSWARVGNPANGDDSTGFGGVGYVYQMSKFEVTNGQYVAFLNGVDPTGDNQLGVYNPYMSSYPSGPAYSGGIDYNSGAANGGKYQPKLGQENKPVVWVKWSDTARFVNWLSNGQGSGNTERGVYDMSQAFPARAFSAKYFLPNPDEWYKSAYHQPANAGGDSDDYWLYPTRTNAEPNSDQPPGDVYVQNNVANCWRDDGLFNGYNDGFAVTGATNFDSTKNYFTDVGTYSFAPSFYGTFDQGGNVWEWLETPLYGYYGLWGGSFADSPAGMEAANLFATGPTPTYYKFGFRVASIPEPSSLAATVFAACATVLRRKARLTDFSRKEREE